MNVTVTLMKVSKQRSSSFSTPTGRRGLPCFDRRRERSRFFHFMAMALAKRQLRDRKSHQGTGARKFRFGSLCLSHEEKAIALVRARAFPLGTIVGRSIIHIDGH